MKKSKIIGLVKTRWVERHQAYDTYYQLYRCVVSTLESISERHTYQDFYAHLEEKFNEPWTWDTNTKTQAQGLCASCTKFEHLISFSILFNGLEPLKPLVSKLQKRNQDIYKAYHMIDSVITDLERNHKNLDEEFIESFQLAVDMAEYVGAEIKAPNTTVFQQVSE